MNYILKAVLIGSLLLNLIAIWGFFHYIRYGGSPLGEIKRRITRSAPKAPVTPSSMDDNARIKQELAEGKVQPNRVVFFGASITRMWDLDKHFPEFHMINRGVGGQLVPALMARFKRDVIDLRPDAVIIKFCSINIRPEQPLMVLEDGMTMLTQLAQANHITPIVCTIIPTGKPAAHVGDFRVVDSLQKFNQWVRDFARQNNVDLIDLAKAIEDSEGFLPREYAADPIHVNEKGYALLSDAARPVIAEALRRGKAPETQ